MHTILHSTYISICIHSSIRTYIQCTLHTYSHSTLHTCTLHPYIQLHLYSIHTNNYKLCTLSNFIRLDTLLTIKLYDQRYWDGSKIKKNGIYVCVLISTDKLNNSLLPPHPPRSKLYNTLQMCNTSDTTILSTYMNTNNYTLHTYMIQLHSNILYKCTYTYSYTYIHIYTYSYTYVHTYIFTTHIATLYIIHWHPSYIKRW